MWACFLCSLTALKGGETIDIVLDNAGFELFTDLCLAHVLVTVCKASKVNHALAMYSTKRHIHVFLGQVVFHAKRIPWFVSDVTLPDFEWALAQLEQSGSRLKVSFDTQRVVV